MIDNFHLTHVRKHVRNYSRSDILKDKSKLIHFYRYSKLYFKERYLIQNTIQIKSTHIQARKSVSEKHPRFTLTTRYFLRLITMKMKQTPGNERPDVLRLVVTREFFNSITFNTDPLVHRSSIPKDRPW